MNPSTEKGPEQALNVLTLLHYFVRDNELQRWLYEICSFLKKNLEGDF